ncbi:hypothetical protein NIES22_67710 (plasmid) [Calothrix brevissima NIES-22]|nr:hypothetical protein NIES22_67710 [Calothrix brevissima NIES-22]
MLKSEDTKTIPNKISQSSGAGLTTSRPPISSHTRTTFSSTLQYNPVKQSSIASKPVNTTVSLRQGDTLWEVAQKKLGNGTRWRELRKADGSQFTQQEVRHLPVGTLVSVPWTKPTIAKSHKVNSFSQIQHLDSESKSITRRELSSGSTHLTRSKLLNASPRFFSQTSLISSKLPSSKSVKPSEYFLAESHQKSSTQSGNSSNTRNSPLLNGTVTGSIVGFKTQDFFLAKRLDNNPRVLPGARKIKDSKALALAERKIRAQLGDDGIRAFYRTSQVASPREAYTVLRRYIDHASQVAGSKQLLENLASGSKTTVKGAIGEIRQIPKSRIRRSRIELVADTFISPKDNKTKNGADRVYKPSPFSKSKLIVDVKNYDFTSKYYQKPSNISRKNIEFSEQVARYKKQFPGARIKYEFVGSGRVPREIVNNLHAQKVKVKVPTRIKVLNAAHTVKNSRPATPLIRGANTVRNSVVKPIHFKARETANAVKNSRTGTAAARSANIVRNSPAASKALRVTRTVTQSGVTKGVLRGASRVAAPVGIALDTWQLGSAYKKDGFGKEFRKTAGSVAGAWGGAAAGAAIGSAIFPGVGTVVGGAIGGIAGSAWGDDIEQGAEKAGKAIAGGAKKVWNKLFG